VTMSRLCSLVCFLAFSLLPLQATTIWITLDNSLFTSQPGATTITFDSLNAATPSPYTSGLATYTWTTANSPFVTGSVAGQYASPPSDATGYFTVGSGDRPATVTIDFSKPIYYFGLYGGSPDSYNSMSFYSDHGQTLIASFAGSQLVPGHEAGGNQSEGFFINFHISGGSIGEIVMSSSRAAFETDNHAYTETPEPATWAGLGLGLTILAAARRQRKRTI
jgi:PEP-CTERM motif